MMLVGLSKGCLRWALLNFGSGPVCRKVGPVTSLNHVQLSLNLIQFLRRHFASGEQMRNLKDPERSKFEMGKSRVNV